MSNRVEVIVVAGPRGPSRARLQAGYLAGAAPGEAAALRTDDPAWGLGCACCELRGALISALTRLVADPRLRRLLVDVDDATDPAEVIAVVQSPYLARVLECVGVVGVVLADDDAQSLGPPRVFGRLRRASLVLVSGDTTLVARVREACPEPRVLPLAGGLDLAARVLAGGPGRGRAVVWERPVTLAALEAWLDALPPEVARVDGDARIAEWPGRRAVVRKLGARALIYSSPREGLDATRLWVVTTEERVALGEL